MKQISALFLSLFFYIVDFMLKWFDEIKINRSSNTWVKFQQVTNLTMLHRLYTVRMYVKIYSNDVK